MNNIYRLDFNMYERGEDINFFEVPEGSTEKTIRAYVKEKFRLSTDINDDLCFLGDEKLDNLEDNYIIRFEIIAKGYLI